MSTHQVINQTPPLENYNIYESDPFLKKLVEKEGLLVSGDEKELIDFGASVGRAEFLKLGFLANENIPKLKTHDRFGNRIDEVEFHPSWHVLMKSSVAHGLHGSPWTDTNPQAHLKRALLYYLIAQVESGHGCPITMTYAAVPALRAEPELAAFWEPKLTSHIYDERFIPASKKQGVIFGMGMTEKQGGSDVRANTTKAELVSGTRGKEYVLTGHKWFCSAPTSDAFLVLAQAPQGLTCFLVPRWKPDGTRNVFMIQRLKDKLGNKSNASSEIEFENTWAHRVGEEGRGVATIIRMVSATRLDCIIGSSAIMRQAYVQALHHAQYRETFGKRLIDHPLMQNVLTDLSLEVESASVLAFRLAKACDLTDKGKKNDFESLLLRIGTAIGKYWVCKRAPSMIFEAMESLGGNGYAEESVLPRLYREAPVNSIWEGSGNVNALDLLRALGKDKDAFDQLVSWLEERSPSAILKENLNQLKNEFSHPDQHQFLARRMVERLVLSLQSVLMLESSDPNMAELFIDSRLGGKWGHTFGTLAGPAR